jgi:hypothetical protein
LEQRLLIGSEQAQVIRSAAFHEAQKIRVINNLPESVSSKSLKFSDVIH